MTRLNRCRPRRQRFKMMRVFGEGSGEALFAKRASPETLQMTRKICDHFRRVQ